MSFFKRIADLFSPQVVAQPPTKVVQVKQYVRSGENVKEHKRRIVKVKREKPIPVTKPKRPPKRMKVEDKEWARAYRFRIWLAEQDGKPYLTPHVYMRRQYGCILGKCMWNGHGANTANTICAEQVPYVPPLGVSKITAKWIYWFYCPTCADDWEKGNVWAGYKRKK